MLVLARKKGESIIIGDDIELIVIGTEGDTVRLGIKAPKSIGVYRKEIYNAIQDANKEAMSTIVPASILRKLLNKDEL